MRDPNVNMYGEYIVDPDTISDESDEEEEDTKAKNTISSMFKNMAGTSWFAKKHQKAGHKRLAILLIWLELHSIKY